MNQKTLHIFHGKDQIQAVFYGKNKIWEDVSGSVIVKVKPDDGTHGTTIGSGLYEIGSIVRIEAIPFPGWKFKQWSNGIKSQIQLLTINEDSEFIAYFEENLGIINYKENYK